jgi:hypothetical protein
MKLVANKRQATAAYRSGEAYPGALAQVGVGTATGQDIIPVVTFDKRCTYVNLTGRAGNQSTAGL